jgi:type I restriction enzyme R subunit
MTESEAQTRSQLIDQQLALAGWNVKDPTQVVEEFDIVTALREGVAEPRTPYDGHQFSDYVLLGKDRKPLAVIEAKRTSRDATIGREQAKQYCYNIQKQLGDELRISRHRGHPFHGIADGVSRQGGHRFTLIADSVSA